VLESRIKRIARNGPFLEFNDFRCFARRVEIVVPARWGLLSPGPAPGSTRVGSPAPGGGTAPPRVNPGRIARGSPAPGGGDGAPRVNPGRIADRRGSDRAPGSSRVGSPIARSDRPPPPARRSPAPGSTRVGSPRVADRPPPGQPGSDRRGSDPESRVNPGRIARPRRGGRRPPGQPGSDRPRVPPGSTRVGSPPAPRSPGHPRVPGSTRVGSPIAAPPRSRRAAW
jgi:hypothetical protein